jgi:hypothetical protein
MLKKTIWIGILVLSVSVSFIFAQQRTVVRDRNARAMLLGTHKLSLQWISWDYFGTATVTNRAGTLYLKGSQRGRGDSKSDYLTIDGVITSVSAKEFKFSGKIVTRVSHINGGAPCERDDDFTFRITGNRKYWRLQEMDNPCDGVTDYVDIYFK